MDEAKLEALLNEATAHCYDDEDTFWGIFSALMANISYPLQASVGGETVTLTALDGPTSTPEDGVMARVEKGGQEEVVALAEVEALDPGTTSGEWLAVYRMWWGKKG